MAVRGKALVGPILGIIGAMCLIIAGFIVFGQFSTLEARLALLGYTWADIGFDPSLIYLSMTFTLIWGVLGLIGAIMGFMGKKIGAWLMLIFGLIATVGMFVPLGTVVIMTIPVAVISLNGALFFVDPILLLLGGILGLALKE